jgi:hypothetical protein
MEMKIIGVDGEKILSQKNIEQSSDLGKTIIERMINYHPLLRSLNSSEENYKELLSKTYSTRSKTSVT